MKEITPSKARKTALLIALLMVCTALAVLAAAVLASPEGIYHSAIEQTVPAVAWFMRTFTHVGDTLGVCLVMLSLYVFPAGRKTVALPVTITVAASALLNRLIKILVRRPRPSLLPLIVESGYSFPSGHAMNNATLYIMLAIMAFTYLKSPRARAAAIVSCSLLLAFIGYSRVYLGVHYVSDVITGYFLGASLAVLSSEILRRRQLAKTRMFQSKIDGNSE